MDWWGEMDGVKYKRIYIWSGIDECDRGCGIIWLGSRIDGLGAEIWDD